VNWLSFFIGVLVGWIVEWFIDVFYWRRRCQTVQEENEALHRRLDEVQGRLTALEREGVEGRLAREREMARPDAVVPGIAGGLPSVDVRGPDLTMPEGDLEVKTPEVTLPRADLDVEAPEVDLPEAEMDWRAPEVTLPRADLDVEAPEVDLPEAEMGWRAPEVTLPRADLDVEAPDLTLPDAALDLRAPDVTLPEAAGGVMGGAAAAMAGEPGGRDDLKRIEGIGPKIARLLNEHGIYTFAQLASTSTDRLQEILEAGGPNFQLADPGTWPEQARLAAEGAWDEFEALQLRLIRGRHSGPSPR